MPRKNRLQSRNGAEHFRPAGLHGRFDLREGGEGDFLLAAAEGLLLRQGGEEAEPVQGILFRYFHDYRLPFVQFDILKRIWENGA